MSEFSLLLPLIVSGTAMGFLTGIIPGIHVNTVAALMLSATASLTAMGLDTTSVVAFISALAIAHTFFDIIPGLFIGVPGDAVFAQLPGHRLVRNGYGKLAIRLSAVGSSLGLLMGIFLSGALILASEGKGWQPLENLEQGLSRYMFLLLLAVSLLLTLTEKNRLASLSVFFASGFLGVLVFNTPIIPGGSSAPVSSLFPALAGLFGIAGLLWALLTLGKNADVTIKEDVRLTPSKIPLPSIRGGLAGIVVGLLPGLGAANAATILLVLERWLKRKSGREEEDRAYLVTTSALNTSEAIIAITALYLIHKSRSGASIAIDQLLDGGITADTVQLVLVSMAAGGIISALLLWHAGPYLAGRVKRMDYPSLNWAVMFFVLFLCGLLLGIGGIAVLAASAIIGLLPFVLDVRRGQLMGFFLVPTMLFYSGHAREIHNLLYLSQRQAPGIAVKAELVGAAVFSALVISFIAYRIIRSNKVPVVSHRLFAGRVCIATVFTGIGTLGFLLA